MATSKKQPEKKEVKTPVKRVYKKRVPKPKVEKDDLPDTGGFIEEIKLGGEPYTKPKRTIKEWATANKWFIIAAVAVILFALWFYYKQTSGDKVVERSQKREEKPLQQLEVIEENKDSIAALQKAAEQEYIEAIDRAFEAGKESAEIQDRQKVQREKSNQQIKKYNDEIYDKNTPPGRLTAIADSLLRARRKS